MTAHHQKMAAGLALVALVTALHCMVWVRLGQHKLAAVPSRSAGSMQVRLASTSMASAHTAVLPVNASRVKTAIHAASGDESAAHWSSGGSTSDPSAEHDALEHESFAAATVQAVASQAPLLASKSPVAAVEAEFPSPPLYAARVPESARLSFVAERGARRYGEATLDWQRDGDLYRLSLRLSAESESDDPLILLTSTGHVDVHGLRPERFVDSRQRRAARAVTLQCDGGAVSYSATTQQRACVAGMQDNLSWWVQLSAIVAASPILPKAGAELSVAVTRTHGSVDLWTFEVIGEQGLRASSETDVLIPAIKLVRKPGRTNRAYDTNAEVWLDAAPPHWPLRVRLQEARGEPMVWTRVSPASVN